MISLFYNLIFTNTFSMSKLSQTRNNIPDTVQDKSTGKMYKKGKFLGKGGFALCYEFTDTGTMEVYAGKVVSKTQLVKPHQKEKMTQEIQIHRSVKHRHIVGFECYFEDEDNVYIMLELCKRRSLMELHKRRKRITEPEARYFIKQMLEALLYLHAEKILHRDLKLGNLFLDDELEIKIGDFGLATQLDHIGERKRTLCGTPNYIAPEILRKTGHSFAVDVWSMGCIMYTLLCGRPPFETSTLKETYARIKENNFNIPSSIDISLSAKDLIHAMLRGDPLARPTVEKLLDDRWFKDGYCPTRLPSSCLTMEPRLDKLAEASNIRPPFFQLQPGVQCRGHRSPSSKGTRGATVGAEDEKSVHLQSLMSLITSVAGVNKTAPDLPQAADDAEDPALVPIYWIAKWVDYSDKYGLGYQLSDDSIGVLFNDSTRLITINNGDNLQYIDRDATESFHSIQSHPETLSKKVVLLKYFRNYMAEHLVKTGAHMKQKEGDEMVRLPFLRTWFRTRSAIVLLMSNGTLQINFFADHTKIIICTDMSAVTLIDEQKNFRTFKMDSLQEACSNQLSCRLKYAKMMVERIMSMKSSSAGSTRGSRGSERTASASAATVN